MKVFIDMKKLNTQKSLRPTTGKVREALFDILQHRIKGARFLDLYAGTGAVGIEALKKGASSVVFVEAGKRSANKIGEDVIKYHYIERAEIVSKKAVPFIEWAGSKNYSFDLIFMDPPYHTEDIMLTLNAIGSSSILSKDGLLIAEHFKKRNLPEKFVTLQKLRDYHYGDTVLSFYEPAFDSRKHDSSELQNNQERLNE
jgi:16S rRNA (guanine966-N2)-methyltransferase